MGFGWFKSFASTSSGSSSSGSSGSSGDYATAAELTAETTRAEAAESTLTADLAAEVTRAKAAEDALTDALEALPSSSGSSGGSIEQEFVSCDGTGTGEGTTAGVIYSPSNPTRTAEGSLIPAVAISGSTSTFYNLPVATEIKATDKVFLEINTGNGWFGIENSQDAMSPGLMLGDAFVGVSLDIPTTAVVRVRWSNLGRLTGINYGTARYDWAAVRALGWRWRVRKVSFGG